MNESFIPVSRPLYPAEKHFLQCMESGNPCFIGDTYTYPTEPIRDGAGANVVRADIIRFLAAGGDQYNKVKGDILHLRGAWVDGLLNLDHARIPYALKLQACHFGECVNMNYAECRFLDLRASRLADGFAGSGMKIQDDALMGDKLLAEEVVHLVGANIGGSLICDNGEFQNLGGYAINASDIKIGDAFLMRRNFCAGGTMNLYSADIGGGLYCGDANINGGMTAALIADKAKIGGDFLMHGAFQNMVCLINADIGGNLGFGPGKFENPFGAAIDAPGVRVRGSVTMSRKFVAEGFVHFPNARIGNNFNCDGGEFIRGINLQGAQLKSLFWRNIDGHGDINLAYATAGVFVADKKSLKNFEFYLEGFNYDRLIENLDIQSILGMLTRLPENVSFSSQPFEQAAKARFAVGRGKDARRILFEMEKCRTHEKNSFKRGTFWRGVFRGKWRHARRHLQRRLWLGWRRFFEKTTGYNYLPVRMLITSLAIVMAGALGGYAADSHGYIVPHQPVVLANADYKNIVHNKKAHVGKCSAAKRPRPRPTEAAECLFPDYPKFDAFGFSADVFIPLFAWHQEPYWYPQPRADTNVVIRKLLLWWYWLQILAGWVLTSIFVLTVTGIMQRSQSIWGGK